jgi:hypothetical protein
MLQTIHHEGHRTLLIRQLTIVVTVRGRLRRAADAGRDEEDEGQQTNASKKRTVHVMLVETSKQEV